MHHLEIPYQFGRHRYLAPVPDPTLERADPGDAGVEVHIECPHRQDLAHPGADVGDRGQERLVGRPFDVRGRGDEAPALVGRQVLAAAPVGQLQRRIRVTNP